MTTAFFLILYRNFQDRLHMKSTLKDTSEHLKDEPEGCDLPSSIEMKYVDKSGDWLITKGLKKLEEAVFGKSEIQEMIKSILRKCMLRSKEKEFSFFRFNMKLYLDREKSRNM
jgi:hypothetical protein